MERSPVLSAYTQLALERYMVAVYSTVGVLKQAPGSAAPGSSQHAHVIVIEAAHRLSTLNEGHERVVRHHHLRVSMRKRKWY